jgi:hypothetical protein
VHERWADDQPHAGATDDDASFDWLTRERQALTQMLDRGRSLSGQKAPEPMLKAFGPIGITNPMAAILRQADTLELTPQQADSIAVLNRAFTIKLDSIWTPVSKFLAALPDIYDQGEAYDRYRIARQTSVDGLVKVAPTARSLLTDDQHSASCRRPSRCSSTDATRRPSVRHLRHRPWDDHGRRDGHSPAGPVAA